MRNTIVLGPAAAATIILLSGLSLFPAGARADGQKVRSPYEAVDPFIGTDAGGNTNPGATVPFGMIQWGPDTRADGWYHYTDGKIRGFSLTHISGAGCPIYADVPVLPWTGAITSPGSDPAYELAFVHDHERAQPGYYAVEFTNGVKVELTAADRAGIGRFLFPRGATPTLLIKAGSSATAGNAKRRGDASTVEIRGRDTIVGSVRSGGFCGSDSTYVLYFVLTFRRPFAAYGTWTTAVSPGSAAATGHEAGAYVTFPRGGKPVLAKVGISFVSIANAEANLKAGIPGWDFAGVREAARQRWSELLGRVAVDGGTLEQRTTFYTGLYHMLLSPNLFSDANGDSIGFDGQVRRLAPGEAQYANFSDWDIYRNVVPLHALLLPTQASQMAQSLVRDAEQSGWLPRWPVANDVSYVMGGDSSAIVLAEADAFGARGFDEPAALRYMLKGATQPGVGPHGKAQRPGLADYLSRGYVPVGNGDETGASVTLEYASADFAISQLAAALGDRAHAARLRRSAQNWRTLVDPDSGFIRPRTADGKFLGGWDPDRLLPRHTTWDKDDQMGFEEGSTWQYTWMIPHNYGGLIAALGGDAKVEPKLDRFFEKVVGWGVATFTVTNEPDFCAPYVYLWTGHPAKTAAVIDRIRREAFASTPDGLPGNDDLGATSGVYVWNALGLYPLIPGVGGLAVGTPLFRRAVVQLGDGRTLEIRAAGDGPYVEAVRWNGRPLARAWLPLEEYASGENKLEFTLSPKPGSAWATRPAEYPPSFDAPAP